MPIFECSKCKCIDNTALTNHSRNLSEQKKLCSECDPAIGKWHGRFAKTPARGMLLGSDGYLYSKKRDLEKIKKYQGVAMIKEL